MDLFNYSLVIKNEAFNEELNHRYLPDSEYKVNISLEDQLGVGDRINILATDVFAGAQIKNFVECQKELEKRPHVEIGRVTQIHPPQTKEDEKVYSVVDVAKEKRDIRFKACLDKLASYWEIEPIIAKK